MYKLVVMVVTMLLVLGVVVNGCVHSAVAGAGSLPQFSCCQPLQPEPRQQGKWRGGDTSTLHSGQCVPGYNWVTRRHHPGYWHPGHHRAHFRAHFRARYGAGPVGATMCRVGSHDTMTHHHQHHPTTLTLHIMPWQSLVWSTVMATTSVGQKAAYDEAN